MSLMETSFRAPAVPLTQEPANALQMRPKDETRVDGNGLSLAELEKFLLDMREEPAWREQANRCADYYDHNQLTDEVLAEFRRLNLPPLVINLIHPTINTVLGMEAKNRTDWQVTFDDPQFEEVALALGQKMNEAERETGADRAISNAYAGQIKAGLHWVEVGWHSNPFARSRYRVRDVHRRECWWDWRRRDIEEWRYFVRKQRFDADQLRMAFGHRREILEMIDAAIEGGVTWQEYAVRLDEHTGLGQFIDIQRALTFEDQNWVDAERKQIWVFEVWYQKWVRGYVARIGDTVIEVDRDNPRHMLAIANGAMTPQLATFPKMRQAIYIGPQRVFDRPSPMPHRRLPYAPFFGYREDLTGAPYGLIRGMLSSQDEINSRRSKMRAMLNSRRVMADSDALAAAYNTHEDVADEASRHDSYVVLNPDRKNGQYGFRIEDNADLSNGQASVLQESKSEINQTSGVFPPMAGENKGGLSGLAIHSLVEQGTQTLAEINDNYTWARREVGDLLMEHVKYDTVGQEVVGVGEGKARRTIELNRWDPAKGVTANNVKTARVKLVLEDVPSTPAWRQQQSAHLAEITKGLPPALQQFIVPFYIEGTDLKDRKKVARLLRQQLGIPEEGMEDQQPQIPPEVQQQLQEYEAQLAEISAKFDAAVAEAEKLKVQNANKQAEVRVDAAAQAAKAEDAARRTDIEEERLKIEKLQALATVHKAEDPKGVNTPVSPDLQPAIDEMLATMREGFGEFHERMSAIERRGQEEEARRAKEQQEKVARKAQKREAKAKRPPPAPAAPPVVNITNNIPPPAKAKGKTVTLPGGEKARIEPDADEDKD